MSNCHKKIHVVHKCTNWWRGGTDCECVFSIIEFVDSLRNQGGLKNDSILCESFDWDWKDRPKQIYFIIAFKCAVGIPQSGIPIELIKFSRKSFGKF